jgi:hypothetical protein
VTGTVGHVVFDKTNFEHHLSAGEPFLKLVGDDPWVVANFNENELKHIKLGQRVTIRIEAIKAPPGLLQRARGRRLWSVDPCGHPPLPARHRHRDDRALDCGRGQPLGQYALIAARTVLRLNRGAASALSRLFTTTFSILSLMLEKTSGGSISELYRYNACWLRSLSESIWVSGGRAIQRRVLKPERTEHDVIAAFFVDIYPVITCRNAFLSNGFAGSIY